MNRDDCGADCGICDVCEVSAPETLPSGMPVRSGPNGDPLTTTYDWRGMPQDTPRQQRQRMMRDLEQRRAKENRDAAEYHRLWGNR